TIGRFASIFPGQIAVLHSQLSPAERIGEWRRLASGAARVAIGARSAVFAPVGKDSLFIIDEEHESSYKADDCPRYHARQIAFRRTARSGCLILGSATPSLETLWHASKGEITRIPLDERISAHAEQEVVILDMRSQPQGALVAPPLIDAVKEAVSREEQALFFLNRRGYAPFVTCDDCQTAASCPQCSISLTLHREKGILLCHHCGYQLPFSGHCPACGGNKIRTGGAGTERVAEFLAKRMGHLRLGRVDSDTIGGSKETLFNLLEDFSHKRLDALVGTQMVAKGLDFPDLTIVGILAADAELSLPDFRSFERVHTQLVQVIGRTGRAGKKGRAFIQTCLPGEDPIASIVNHDTDGFFKRELERRRECAWPPFSRLIRIVMRSTEPETAYEAINTCTAALSPTLPPEVTLLGPVSCPIEKRANWWRYHFLLKGPSMNVLASVVRKAGLAEGSRGKVYVEVDVDPQSML
ncbi:MAG TPA: primosomal protein N', partial [Spirochaetota bacterium]|nr:primosomal protein N' [Spirochaetota bacterium]